jgi:L-galactose dehydrogenase
VHLVRAAVGIGITYFDTAPAYGTEEIVGAALAGVHDEVVLSTKVSPVRADGSLLDAGSLRQSVNTSLKNLRASSIDVFHLHAVPEDAYDRCVAELLPELMSLQASGVIRYIALSERFAEDPGHAMLERAVRDDCWDVMMLGFNLLNPSARERVLGATQAKGIGVEVMYAVRRALSDVAELRRVVDLLIDDGQIDPSMVPPQGNPLGFLVHDAGASSLVDAAYRFVRHEPGCDIVLTGTGSLDHLRDNVRSIDRAALPPADLARLEALFGRVDSVTGN